MNLALKLLHRLLQSLLVAREVSGDCGVEQEQLFCHHFYLSMMSSIVYPRTNDCQSYPIIIQKLELDLNIRSQFLKLNFLLVEPKLCLRQPKLIDLRVSGLFVVLQVSPVGIILHPGHLVHLDSGQGVLHGLVDDGVDGADEEVEFEKLRSDVQIKLKFLDDNRVRLTVVCSRINN